MDKYVESIKCPECGKEIDYLDWEEIRTMSGS